MTRLMPDRATTTTTNLVEYTVSELATAIKQTVEGAFGLVRLRGEVSGFRGPHASGHCYFVLKDEKSCIEAVIWRSAYARLKFKPEQGLEVIASGRITTYPDKSKYQIVIEQLEPAGAGGASAQSVNGNGNAHAELAASGGGLCVLTVPLFCEGEPAGALTFERDQAQRFDAETVQSLEAIGATVLANACGPCIGQWQRDDMAAGETIHTENSHKYGARDARILLRAGGVTPWTRQYNRIGRPSTLRFVTTSTMRPSGFKRPAAIASRTSGMSMCALVTAIVGRMS